MKLRLVRTRPADAPRPSERTVCLPPRCQLATFEPWCSDAVGANGGHTFIYTIDR